MGPPERTRPSATVILTRRVPELEVYLLERSRKTRFFPGYHAFPGGVVDASDGEGDEGRRIAALRELFEETGVLVTTKPAPSSMDRAEARTRAAEAVAHHCLEWDSLRLEEAGRLLTPPFSPVRYDTSFFICDLPEGQSPEVDGEENVSGRWWRPAEALRRWEEDAFPIPPPTLAYLHLLASHDDPRAAAAEARATDGKRHYERFRIEFHPGVFVLPLRTPTLPPATTTNCFVFDGERILVVDPGPADDDALVPLFHTLDEMRDGRAIEVVLTHHHADHVGGARALKDRYGARVLAHGRTGALLPQGIVDDVLEDGDIIDLGAWGARPWRLEVLHTPGHAPGHLALRDARWGMILAGDLVSGVSTILVSPGEGDMTQYMASLARCADLKPFNVLPAHGPILPSGAFAKTLEHRAMREKKVIAALADETRSVDELLAVVYDDTPQELWRLARGSLESHLIKLARDGIADRTREGWRRSS